ncbi:ribonuclease BN [Desulfurobacterium thermolithotrophum DSM 11699]|uniref:Ribonuclease BN n=1 Tax=Desulfurobacterium thermolithotrophum (strain DSM 11699 / BSA) TaxID=868864 RepID=F0S127_DESTD|nr:YihY/virulence factor BrkB family protein [Desulfurobacterium thermolithotrophum]ADY73905.1 ribonuclease BN [Desulfurobacterium thermolithotrophum DSM 11699]
MICKKLLTNRSFLRYILYSLCDAVERDYPFYAASIAYYTLVSIIPLFIFLFFLGMTVFQIDFESLIPKEFFNSPLKPIFLQIEQVMNKSGLISGTAAIVMLWFSRGIFLSLEKSFCEILEVENLAGFFYRNLAVILAIFLLWIFMFVFYLAKYLIAALLPQIPILSILSSLLVPILLFAILISMYYFLLPIKIRFNFIFKISTFVFLLLTVFEKIFIWFIFNVSKVSILYSSFAAIIIFLLWIYYSAIVILIGVGIVRAKLIMEEELKR